MKFSFTLKTLVNSVAILFIITAITMANCKKPEVIDANQRAIPRDDINASIANSGDYAVATNPNGIALYQIAFDLKSKSENISYGEKIIFTNETINSESEDTSHWSSVSYKGKKGFVYSIDSYTGKDWLALTSTKAYEEKTNKEESAYSIVQAEKTLLYELPSHDSKQLEILSQFALVHVLASGSIYDPFISNNIDLEMGNADRVWYEISVGGKQGFVFNAINYPTTKILAEIQQKDRIIPEKGYFLLFSEKLTLYSTDTNQVYGSEYAIKVLKKNAFLESTESRFINGEQMYLVYLNNLLDIRLKKPTSKTQDEMLPYAVYISVKDGNYLGEQKYSDYTVANTRFKGDLNAISVMRNEFEKRGIFLNYLNFTLRKMSGGKYPQETYLIASASVGHYDTNVRSIILKQTDGVYEPVSGSLYTSNPIDFIDLDGDGIMEMIMKVSTRGGTETIIYGLRDGQYISLNSILNAMNIGDITVRGKKIRGKKWVTAADGQTSKEEIHFFKYDRGNFVELKK